MHMDKVNYCEHSDLFIAGFLHVKLLSTWAKFREKGKYFSTVKSIMS